MLLVLSCAGSNHSLPPLKRDDIINVNRINAKANDKIGPGHAKMYLMSYVWNATTGTLNIYKHTTSYNMYCSYFFIRSILSIMCDSLNTLCCSFLYAQWICYYAL